MSKQIISSGSAANDRTGDNLRNSAGKINANFNELYTALGNGSLLSVSPVAKSGNYSDLTNKPSLFSGSYDDLTNKPTLFSGSYNALTEKPAIPELNKTFTSGSTVQNTNLSVEPHEISLTALLDPGFDSFGSSITKVKLEAGAVNISSVEQDFPSTEYKSELNVSYYDGVTITNSPGPGAVKSWKFRPDGTLLFPDNSFQGSAFVGDATRLYGNVDQNVNITVRHRPTVSAECAARGSGDTFVADTSDNDDITVVQEGWTVDIDGTVYTVNAIIDGIDEFDIYATGATFVVGTTYTFTNPTATLKTWTFNSDTATLVAPGGAILSSESEVVGEGDVYRDFSIELPTPDGTNEHRWSFTNDGNLTIPVGGDIRDADDNSLLTNTIVTKSTDVEITNAQANYDNAVAAWEYARAYDFHYAVEQGTATEEGWPFSVWYVDGTNADQYLTELETAWQIQQMPTSPPSELIFNPPISSALYATIRSGLVYVRNSYQLWQQLLSSVDITTGTTKLSVLANDKLVVPDLIQTNPDEDLVIRTRYTLMSSPPGSSTNYQNRDFIFGTNGALTFPNGTVQSGAAIDLNYLQFILANSYSFDDFKNQITSL